MLRSESVVCVSSIDWDANWQGHQEIMSVLAQAGNDVLFIENTGVRSPTLRDLPRLRKRMRNWRRGRQGLRTELEHLVVHSPLLLPFPYSPRATNINSALLARTCRRWINRVGREHPILWTFLPTPLIGDLVSALRPELTIYYCVDDLASSSPGASPIRASEDELLRTADLVFVTAERLRVRASRFRDQVHVIPAGVSFADFDRVRGGPVEPPAEIRRLPGPIVGYVGGLNQKTDQALLAEVAGRLPQVQFVVIGPVQTQSSEVGACPNVHLLGHRPHAEIPRYLKGMGAGIIPYRVTEYTSHIYPAKLNEYLAMGLAVIATPLPEVVRFNETHGDVVTIADTADAFCAGILRALDDTSSMSERRRIAVAHGHRWELRITAMTDLVAHALAARRETGSAGRLAAVSGGRA